MSGRGGWWRGMGIAVLLLLVVVPSMTTAATTVRTFTASNYLVETPALATLPPVTIGAHAGQRFVGAPGYAAAGTQGSSPGLQGVTVTLAACRFRCTDNYRPASSAAIAAGHYAERVTFTVTQPASTGTATGFDVEVAVHLTTGWFFGSGYFSTGRATRAVASTITLRFFVDLGTTAPTVTAVEVSVNSCLSTAGCP